MKAYDYYKDSGIHWLPYIPFHWSSSKVKSHFRLRAIKVSDQDYPALSVSKNGVTPQIETAIKTDNGDNRKLVKAGDFVVNSRSDRKGSCGVSTIDGSVSLINIVLEPINGYAQYYHYLFRSNDYIEEFYRYGRGIVSDLWTTRWNEMSSIMIPFPPVEEQKMIVAYLDKRITLIENCKCQRERELQTLNELKQAEIASVVTRGLNPDVPMKDSGIFWQPLIPMNWSVTKLKHVLSKLDRPRRSNDELLVCSNSGDVKKRGDSKLGLVADSDEIYQGVRCGDLLIHGMDTWHGAIAVSNYDGMCTPVVHVCDSTQNKKYVALYLKNMAYQKVFKLISNGVRQNTSDFRSWSKVGAILIPIPPIEEQNAIVEYIESKTNKIDTMIEALKAEIDRLTEYKQRLISDVVTGQIDVRSEEI